MSFAIGESVGPYRVLAQLGQGGMATVYKAHHAALDRYVAIKVLHAAFKEDPTFIARFEREAKVVAKLEHPHIVPIYDFAEHEGQPYLVMKYIEGETLKARLARGALTIEEGVRLVEAVGAALAHAHRQGILHRDIKPSNVLLTPDGGIFLADFGLARIAAAGETTLSQDMMVGTPQYISPEQAQGVKDLDAGTDIYSFGVVLYELVVGRVPFSADTPFSIIHDHIYSPLPPPRSINLKVPESMERVLLKALAKNREDRYRDVASLVAAFREAAAEVTPGVMAEARPATISPSARTPAPPVAMATDAPFAATLPPKAAEAEKPAEARPKAAPKEKSKGRPWWQWALVGVVGLCGCLFLLFAAHLVRNAGQEATQTAQASAALTASPAGAGPVVTPPPATPLSPTSVHPTAGVTDPIHAAEETVATHPGDPDAHLGLAQVYYEAGRLEDAKAQFKEAVRLSNNRPDVYLRMAEGLMRADDPLLALELLAPGIAANPDNQALKDTASGIMLLSVSQDGALAVYEDYQNRFPDWAMPHVAASNYYIQHGNLVRAARELETARKLDPDNPAIHYTQGNLYERRGDDVAAVAEYEKVLADPNIPGPLRGLAQQRIDKIHGTPLPAVTKLP